MAEDKELRSGRAEPSRAADPRVGTLVGQKYRIIRPIARGGMGKVYRAEQEPLGRDVAIKILDASTAEKDHDGTYQKRFFQEASLCSRLRHPNTVTIFDYGSLEGEDGYYIVMEYIRGRTLSEILAKEGPLPISRAVAITRQICASLREAHEAGILHRDLKPSNILLTTHGDDSDFVKVLDFGLAKQVGDVNQDYTARGTFIGSPRYMPPERIRNLPQGPASDLYSLGIILYEMLAGVPPFRTRLKEGSPVDVLVAQVNDPPAPLHTLRPELHTEPDLEAIVMRCLAKRAEDRFASAAELSEALRELMQWSTGGGVVPGAARKHETSSPDRPRPFVPEVNETEVHSSLQAGSTKRPLFLAIAGLLLFAGLATWVALSLLRAPVPLPESPSVAPVVSRPPVTPPPVAAPEPPRPVEAAAPAPAAEPVQPVEPVQPEPQHRADTQKPRPVSKPKPKTERPQPQDPLDIKTAR